MYKIEKQNYGYKLTFSGQIQKAEMKTWVQEAKNVLSGQQVKEFGVFVDMRELKPLDPDTSAAMVEGQVAFKEKGMVRSVVILSNPIIAMQFRRLGKESGIYQWERYLDSQSTKDFEKVGEDWITKGVDPDKK
jgi:hypothetical protein